MPRVLRLRLLLAFAVVAVAAAGLTIALLQRPANQAWPATPAVAVEQIADDKARPLPARVAEELRKEPDAEKAWKQWEKETAQSRATKNNTRDNTPHTWSRGGGHNYIECHLNVPDGYEHSEVRLMMGDDERWANPGWDDREWHDITRTGVPQRAGIFWVRFRVRSTDAAIVTKKFEGRSVVIPSWLPGGVYQKVNGAFDLFWDGKLLARSGVPGNRRAEETPGKLDNIFSLPEEWRWPGEHVVALRMSTHFSDFPGDNTDFGIGFGSPQELLAEFNHAAFQPTLISGAMFMVAAMGFVLWSLADRRPTLLLFVGLCLCAALTQWLTVWRYYYTYTYDWHYLVRLASVYLSAGFGACLLMFVVRFFAVPRGWWLLAGYAAIVAVIMWWPHHLGVQPLINKAGWEATAAFLLTLVCAGWAAWRRQRGAGLVAASLALDALLVRNRPWDFVEGGYFPSALPVMLGLLSAVALRVRDERLKAEQAQLTAARLEVELLKKNLQPHFLMNTLTALTEVIEQNPRAASALIDDLAVEFRTLSRMSGEKQVTLAEEIELCRVHLRVMSVRTGVAWSLVADEVDEDAIVPPAIFLTLIENAFVHQRPAGPAAVFRLRMAVRDDGVRYTFVSPGEVQPPKTVRVSGGTGLRYVKARLEESFSGRWTFAHRAVPEGWETVIDVRVATHEAAT